MKNLSKHNSEWKATCYYISSNAVVLALTWFLFRNFEKLKITNGDVIYILLEDGLFLAFVAPVIITFLFLIFIPKRETIAYDIKKRRRFLRILALYPLMYAISVLVISLLYSELMDLKLKDSIVVAKNYHYIPGILTLLLGMSILFYSNAFQRNFRKSVLWIGDQFLSKNDNCLDAYNKQLYADAVENEGNNEVGNDTLVKQAEKLVNSSKEQTTQPIGKLNLNIVMYVYGEGFDYCILGSGLDIPFLFEEDAAEEMLAECHFLKINTALYLRVDQIYVFDFESNQVILNPAVDKNLVHIRSKRVKDKVNSYRVEGRASGYFHIHPDLVDGLQKAVDKYASNGYDNM
ncbi:hypothetical protein LZQ00_06010 [Sphingobacterium sp. SRCM116780]|uniref:hypothetical protein n=1 Tax=Sphingobacterium sp. SRCM116780 TaxID=2907623 RepID=UPI001F41A5BA|nr:hypothetical protein [Sphingobacterium sp. SRCM116780]UIR57370.1 hypothetical protein LZQ00_06010 [Sphingobacterium sp. SRCM116780]